MCFIFKGQLQQVVATSRILRSHHMHNEVLYSIMEFISTSLAAGNLAEAGNFTFNVEYSGKLLKSSLAPTSMDCWKRCKETKGDT